MLNRLLLPAKILAILTILFYGYLLAIYVSCFRSENKKRLLRLALAQHWQRLLLQVLGIKITTHGQVAVPGALIVSNHISWLDIVITGSQSPVFFLAKMEVKNWPLIGKLAQLAGTLFINRKGHCSRSINQQIAHSLLQDQSVLIYAEGTSSDGQQILDFHPKLFSSAIESGKPVQPMLIEYSLDNQPDYTVAPFVGDDSFHRHLFRLLSAPDITARISYLPCIDTSLLSSAPDSARILAKQSCISIRSQHKLNQQSRDISLQGDPVADPL